MEIGYQMLLPPSLRRWIRSLVVDCGIRDCRGFHLSHAWLPRLPGIFLDHTWYCSPACLNEALKQKVESRLGAAITDLRLPPRMPFRLVLVASGKVTEEQLAHARRAQANGLGARDLGDALVCLGHVAEDEVAVARAVEAGCLYYGGTAQKLAPEHWLPRSLMEAHEAATVHYSASAKRLLVGFVYRIDHPLLQAIEQVTGCRAEPCIITASAWRRQMAQMDAPAFEEIHEAAFSQGKIVGMIVKHAIASGADNISMGLSSGSIWARLSGGPGGRDLIIDLAAQKEVRVEQIEEEVRRETEREDNKAVPVAAIRAAARAQEPAVMPVMEQKRAVL